MCAKMAGLMTADVWCFSCFQKIHVPKSVLSGPGGQRNAGRSSGLSTAPAVFGLGNSPLLPRSSTAEDRADAVETAVDVVQNGQTPEDVHPVGSFAPHSGVFQLRSAGAVPLGMATSDHVAAWLVAGNGVLEPGLEMFASTPSARNPRKCRTKTEFWKRHGIKRCIACHPRFSVRMLNVRFFRSWFHEVSWNVMSNFVQRRFHLSTLQAWPMKC